MISDFYKTLNVYRGTPTVDSGGNTSITYTLSHTIEGVINQSSSSEINEAGQWGVRMNHKLFCATTEDITSKDEVHYNDSIYRVIGDPKDTIQRGHHFRIMLEKRGVDNNG